jgi:hypothetical protein
MRCRYRLLPLLPLFYLVCGCGSGISEVKGILTWNSSPVEGATVTLIPDGEQPDVELAAGLTDSSGHFSLRSGNLEGVKAGKYKVVVTKLDNIADKLDDSMREDPTKAMAQVNKMSPKGETKIPTGSKSMPGSAMKMMMGKSPGGGGMQVAPKQQHLLPEQYSKADSTPLKVEVPVKEPLKLDLTGEAPKKKK